MYRDQAITITERAPRLSYDQVHALMACGVHAHTVLLLNYTGRMASAHLTPDNAHAISLKLPDSQPSRLTTAEFKKKLSGFVCGLNWTEPVGESVIALAIWHPEQNRIEELLACLEADPDLPTSLAHQINQTAKPREISTPLFEGIAFNVPEFDPFDL